MNGSSESESLSKSASRNRATDLYYARVMEHAVAYFGSRVLDPSRPAPDDDGTLLSRAACEKAAQFAAQADAGERESSAQVWGYRIGSRIYDAYLSGKVATSGVRRLLLAHLSEPGMARKVCIAVIARLRSIQNRAARS
jgi:hypothetical protein